MGDFQSSDRSFENDGSALASPFCLGAALLKGAACPTKSAQRPHAESESMCDVPRGPHFREYQQSDFSLRWRSTR
jgi:hypothetical protein